jgi:transcriptional regulator
MGRKSGKNNALPEPLDMLILKILSRQNLHGYAIVQAIHRSSGDGILIEEGSLYPALQRLEANGWIDGEWGLSASNRRARIYKLTVKGRKRLNHERTRYEQVTLAIALLMAQE